MALVFNSMVDLMLQEYARSRFRSMDLFTRVEIAKKCNNASQVLVLTGQFKEEFGKMNGISLTLQTLQLAGLKERNEAYEKYMQSPEVKEYQKTFEDCGGMKYLEEQYNQKVSSSEELDDKHI